MSTTDAKGAVASGKTAFVTKKIEGNTLIITYGNGKVLRFDTEQLPAEQIQNLKMHGASQKYGDVAAKYSETRDYAKSIAHTEALWAANLAGSWTMKATAVPKDKPLTDDELLRAFTRAMKLPADKAVAQFMELNAEYRNLMRGLPEIKVAWTELQVELEKANLKGKPSNLADLMAKLKTESNHVILPRP